MSNDDRGWNIVFGKARSSLTAKLLGQSPDGELSLLDIGLLLGLLAVVARLFGFL